MFHLCVAKVGVLSSICVHERQTLLSHITMVLWPFLGLQAHECVRKCTMDLVHLIVGSYFHIQCLFIIAQAAFVSFIFSNTCLETKM